MDLSVVIPCYNAGEKIKKCIESIAPLASTIELEIIVVDDGSKDNSATLVKNLEAPFIKLIQKTNGGVSSARNVGIEAATGNYLMFADADDYFTTDKLLEVYKKASDFSCDVLMFGYNYVTPNRVRKLPLPKSKSNLMTQLVDPPFAKKYKSNYLTGRVYQYVYKRSALFARFDESLPYAEDLVFVLDCLSACESFEICDIYAYNYVYEKGSAANSYRPNYYDELKAMYGILLKKGYTKLDLNYLYYMDRALKNFVGRDTEMFKRVAFDPQLKEVIKNNDFKDWTLSEKWRNEAILSDNFLGLDSYYSLWKFCNSLRFFAIKIYTKLRLK